MTTPKQWSDDEVRAEIAAAVAIVREDRFEKFVREKVGKGDDSNPPPPKTDPNNPNPPKEDDPPKKRGSLWWGESDPEEDKS